MIAVSTYGTPGGAKWAAEVTSELRDGKWEPIPSEQRRLVEARTPHHATLKAITAWKLARAGRAQCERCQYEWTPRRSDPKTCPRCGNERAYSDAVKSGRRLLPRGKQLP